MRILLPTPAGLFKYGHKHSVFTVLGQVSEIIHSRAGRSFEAARYLLSFLCPAVSPPVTFSFQTTNILQSV